MHIYADNIQMGHEVKNVVVLTGASIKLRMPIRAEDLF